MKRLLLALLLVAASAQAFAADSYLVNNGMYLTITEHGVCRVVTNNHASGLAIFVPTKTSTAWASFYNGLPPGVTATACTCPLPWGGTIANGGTVTAYQSATPACTTTCASSSEVRICTNGVLSGSFTAQNCTNSTGSAAGGHCWYLATGNTQTCDQACAAASAGSCVLAGIQWGAADNTQCGQVLDALGVPAGAFTNQATTYGCFRYSSPIRFRGTGTPDCNSLGPNANYRRACSCTR